MFLRVTVFCTCGTYLELRVSCARSPRARPLPVQESRIPEETIIYHQRLVCSLLTTLVESSVEGNRGNCSIFDPTRNPRLNNGLHTDRGSVLHCAFRRCQRSVVRTMKSIRLACITDLPSDENRTVGEMKISRSINREFHARSAMYLYYVRPPTRDARFRPPPPVSAPYPRIYLHVNFHRSRDTGKIKLPNKISYARAP